MGILEEWKLTAHELDEIVSMNPSLRGFMFGYVSISSGRFGFRKRKLATCVNTTITTVHERGT